MRNAAGFFVMAVALFGVACGARTSPPQGVVDGGAGADGNGVLDVAENAVGDVLGKWQQVGLVNSSGPCPTNSCSSSWDVSPDGHIAKTRLGDAGGVAQMTPTDLSELDSIVSSKAFLDGMMNGFVCDRPPTDVFVNLRLDRPGLSQTQGVTGCVFSGPSGNLPRRVSELVTKY